MANGPGDKLRDAYDSAIEHYDLPDYDTFSADMQDDEKLRSFRDNLASHYDVPEFDTFKAEMGLLKKKEETSPSASKSEATTTQLASESLDPTEPTVSSEPELFTNYPGKETNQYKIVDGQWQWREKSSRGKGDILTVLAPSEEYTEWKTVKNTNRKKGLDHVFLKGEALERAAAQEDPKGRGRIRPDIDATAASVTNTDLENLKAEETMLDVDVETFGQVGTPRSLVVGLQDFSAAKQNAIQEVNGLTEQAQSEMREATTPAQRDEVRRRFDPMLSDATDALAKVETDEAKNKEDFLRTSRNFSEDMVDKKFQGITAEVIGQEEEEVVPMMEEEFGPLGFTFHETGIGDKMQVESARGNTIDIDLDTVWSDATEARKLRQWMMKNQMTPYEQNLVNNMSPDEYEEWLIKDYARDPEAFGEEAYEIVSSRVKSNLTDFSMEVAQYNTDQDAHDAKVAQFNDKARVAGGVTEGMVEEYDLLAEEDKELKQVRFDLQRRHVKYRNYNQNIERAAEKILFNKAKEEEKIGTTLGGIYNSLLRGLQTPSKVGASIAANIMPYVLTDYGLDPIQYKRYKDEGLTDTEIADIAKKGLVTATEPGLEKGLVDLIGSETTEAYLRAEDRGMFEQAMFGLAETIPALVTGGGSRALTFLNLAGLSYAHMETQMRDNPAFKDISEAEKKMVSIPYAVVMGALENLGFTRLFSKNPAAASFSNQIISKVFSRVPKNSSMEFIEAELKREVKQGFKDGLYKIVGGALVEFETGALQTAAEFGIKDTYDAIKGVDMFQTPEGFQARALDVLKGGVTESIGGFVMGAMHQTSSIARKGVVGANVSNENARILQAINNDADFRSLYATDLKLKILNEEIKASEATDKLNEYDQVAGQMSKIPDNIEDVTKAYDLLSEKSELEKSIDGKDPNLVLTEKNRIQEIDQELQNLTEDAISKQEPSSVDVREQAEVSEKVEERKPEPKPKEPTGKEEVVEADVKKEKVRAERPPVEEKVEEPKKPVEKVTKEPKTTPIEEEVGAEERAKGVSIATILGKIDKKETITVNMRTALRDQFVREARAFREGAKSEKDARKAVAATIKTELSKMEGKLKPRQAKAITDRALVTNLSNPVMAERFADYVSKVVADADYSLKIDNAFGDRKRLRKISKSKLQQAELKGAAKEFATIDPRNVENIDEYLEMADKMKSALQATTTKGDVIDMRDVSNLGDIGEYTNKMLEKQEQINRDMMELQFSEMFEAGVLNKDMSIQDMRSVIDSIGEEKSPTIKNEAAVREQIGQVYDAYTAVIKDTIRTGKDPFTGQEIEYTSAQKRAINSALNLDLDSLSLKEVFQIVDMVANFASNGATGNLENVANYFEGAQDAAEFFKESGKAKKMSKAMRAYDYHFTSLPVMIDTMLTGTKKAVSFMNKSGLNQVVRGSNDAQRQSEKILDSYAKKFMKQKANGKKFNTGQNAYERGMYAFLTRNIVGSEAEMVKEFQRRIRIINESIDYLISDVSSKEEAKKGIEYAKIAKRFGLGSESVTLAQVQKKIDPVNKEAAEWWVSKWGEYYNDLRDVSLNVYNQELGADVNYTPDRYRRRATDEVNGVEEVMNGAFGEFNDSPYNRESSSLMKAGKPSVLPKNRVIDLDFDVNNYSMLEAALVDINTANGIRKVTGFIQSDAYNKMFDAEDGNALKKRISNYILRTRRKEAVREDQVKIFKQVTNTLAKAGTTMALGGIDQMPKQTLSVMLNTLVNSGGRISLVDAFKADAKKWIDESGMPISRRGVQAEANIESADRNLNKAAGNVQTLWRVMGKINEMHLKAFLSNPDKYMARASFIAYYKQNLKSRGMSEDINYDAPMDPDAAEYAQHMVDRQQNISDSNLAGEFFTNKTLAADFLKKTLFPFANFIMNQKSRMYADIRTLASKQGEGDKIAATKSLAGLVTELAAFHMVSIMIRSFYKEIANKITGYVPEEEDNKINKEVKKENKRRKLEGETEMAEQEEGEFRYDKRVEFQIEKDVKTFWTSVLADILSPVPPADDLIVMGFNAAVEAEEVWRLKDSEEADEAVKFKNAELVDRKKPELTTEEESKFRKKWAKEEAFQLWDFEDNRKYGTIGIGYEKWQEYQEMAEAADEGTVTTDYYGHKNVKFLTPEDQDIAVYNKWAMRLYTFGLLPADFGKEARYIQKNLVKSALTEKQMGKYKEILEKKGEVTKEDLKMIKDGKKVSVILRQSGVTGGTGIESTPVEF